MFCSNTLGYKTKTDEKSNIVSPIFLLYQNLIIPDATVGNFDKNIDERCVFIRMIILKLMGKTFYNETEEKLTEKVKELKIYILEKEPFTSYSVGVNSAGTSSITIPLYFFIDYDITNLPASLVELQAFLNKATKDIDYEFNYQLTQRDWFKFNKICHFLRCPKAMILKSLKMTFLHELGHLYYHHPTAVKHSDLFIHKLLSIINKDIADKVLDKYIDLYIFYLKYFPLFLYKEYQQEKLADEFIARLKDPSLSDGVDVELDSKLTTTDNSYDKFLTGTYRWLSFFTHGSNTTRRSRIKEAHKSCGISCHEKESSGHSYIARMSKDFP